MKSHLLRLLAATAVLTAAFGASAPPASADVGESPAEAEPLPSSDFRGTAVWEPGESHWFRVGYPGGDQPLAITLHLRPEDAPIRELVNVYVNIRERKDETLGEPNLDWPGYSRIGQVTQTENSGQTRRFWMNASGGPDTYWLLVRNGSPRRVALVLSIEMSKEPAQYIEPPLSAGPPAQAQPPASATPAQPAEPATPAQPAAPDGGDYVVAWAELIDRTGQTAGYATLIEDADGLVTVQVEAMGLGPGLHGLHLHQVGACEPPTFASAGPHFNPTTLRHGLESPDGPHAGDLPNLLVLDDGTGWFETTTDLVTISPGPWSVMDADGTAIVIHSMADDHVTDPAGNSGDPVACGALALAP